MAVTQPRTKVLETVDTKDFKTVEEFTAKTGIRPGSPINGKNVGDIFGVTLTGKIEIREFQGQKGAYYTTKEGYSIRVNAAFNPTIHHEGAKLQAICREFPREGQAPIKFCAFVDHE
jgi:hypothetical protein